MAKDKQHSKKLKKQEREKFKKLWTQEASNQPGFVLDVLLLNGFSLNKNKPPSVRSVV